MEGPWLLFDNHADPYQLQNLVGESSQLELVDKLDDLLSQKLTAYEDEFLPGLTYVKRYGYPELNEWETVPYRN